MTTFFLCDSLLFSYDLLAFLSPQSHISTFLLLLCIIKTLCSKTKQTKPKPNTRDHQGIRANYYTSMKSTLHVCEHKSRSFIKARTSGGAFLEGKKKNWLYPNLIECRSHKISIINLEFLSLNLSEKNGYRDELRK